MLKQIVTTVTTLASLGLGVVAFAAPTAAPPTVAQMHTALSASKLQYCGKADGCQAPQLFGANVSTYQTFVDFPTGTCNSLTMCEAKMPQVLSKLQAAQKQVLVGPNNQQVVAFVYEGYPMTQQNITVYAIDKS